MNALDRRNGPIFIGGVARSGKTYMRLMLAAHPDIAVSKRTRLWTYHYARYGALSEPRNLDRCLAALQTNKHIRALVPDPNAIRRAFQSGPATYARLFAILHEMYAASLGKRRWGDQSEGIELVAPLLFESYPDARLIHLIRDPRDQYEALLAHRPSSRWRIADSTARWNRSAQRAIANTHCYPDRYLVIRYETLVARLPEVVQTVCNFAGIEPVPEMISLGNAPRFGKIDPGTSPLSTDYIGRFRCRLAPYEIAFIQQRAGLRLQAFGYTAEDAYPSRLDSLRFRALEGLSLAFGDRHPSLDSDRLSKERLA